MRFALLFVAGRAGVPPHAGLAAPQPVFVPTRFFAGRIDGHTRLAETITKGG